MSEIVYGLTLTRKALPVKMKSAYKEVYGAEPEFTNYAQTLNRPAFIETLDYIFTSQEVCTSFFTHS